VVTHVRMTGCSRWVNTVEWRESNGLYQQPQTSLLLTENTTAVMVGRRGMIPTSVRSLMQHRKTVNIHNMLIMLRPIRLKTTCGLQSSTSLPAIRESLVIRALNSRNKYSQTRTHPSSQIQTFFPPSHLQLKPVERRGKRTKKRRVTF
jgi:hypothetical protein